MKEETRAGWWRRLVFGDPPKTSVTLITPGEIAAHEREDHATRRDRAPAWKGFPEPWVERSTCDRCRGVLGYVSVNLAVPRGTPVVCGPCTREGPP